jgi:serine protease Do|tara:strand:- start:259 stop:1317 length:1059 start_codon:yes stop_codon:yes gene_type:complete
MLVPMLNRAPKTGRTLLAIIGLFAASPIASAANPGLGDLQSTIQSVFQEHSSAVVRVKVATETQTGNGEPKVVLRVFSGFFISDKGQVLTSYMPPSETTRVWIEQNGISYLADILGADARTNIALLQIINLPKSFDFIELVEDKDPQTIGSFAFAITSPLDFDPTPKFGLVTGFESHFAEVEFPFTYTRLSIPIGPAEGGSPAFDANNELIGIVMATLPEVNSSYIIPTKALARIVGQIKEYQKVRYGVIPISFEEKADSYNQSKRVLIKSIVPGSPAERSGLRPKDILLSLDDASANSLNEVRNQIFIKTPGDFILFKVKRDDKELEFAILLEPQEDHIRSSDTRDDPKQQ